MKKSKKILALLLSVLCFLAFGFSCNKDEESESSSSAGSSGIVEPIEPAMTNAALSMPQTSPDYESIDESKYTTYYFDSKYGKNYNEGTSENSPYQTLALINSIIAEEVTEDKPTRILIKAGSSYSGVLNVADFEAKKETPLIIGVYGVTETEKYAAIINTEKDFDTCVQVHGSNVRISGLEISNPDGLRGMRVWADTDGATENIVLSGNYFHDINFRWQRTDETPEEVSPADFAASKTYIESGTKVYDENFNETDEYVFEKSIVTVRKRARKIINGIEVSFARVRFMDRSEKWVLSSDVKTEQSELEKICPEKYDHYNYGALRFEVSTKNPNGPSWYENVWVENNNFERVACVGMYVHATWARCPGMNWGFNHYYDEDTGYYPNRNFVIRGNNFSYVGGDSIVLTAARDSYIERNVSYHSSYLARGGHCHAGIWIHSSRRVIMQYNEAAYTHLDNGAGDGEGFDIDIGCSDILFQYNYAHHNANAGLLLCNLPTTDYVYDENGKFVIDASGVPVQKTTLADWNRVTIRNNIFADNGKQGDDIAPNALWVAGPLSNFEFSNNIVVMSGLTENQQVIETRWNGIDPIYDITNWKFYNNIFTSRTETPVSFKFQLTNDYFLDNNLFFNIPNAKEIVQSFGEKCKNVHYFDPKINLSEAVSGYENIINYIPQAAEIYSTGLVLAGTKDIRGNDVSGVKYLGAFGKK